MSLSTPGFPCGRFEDASSSRRDFFARCGTGLGGIALASLLAREGRLAHAAQGDIPPDGGGLSPTPGEAADPPPHHPPRAVRAVQIFLQGALSQVDSFDYKPELERLHGTEMPADERPDVFFQKVGLLHRSHFEFRQRGESGLWISELFPNIAGVADELALIRSMFAETGNHTPATYQANSGWRTLGFPAMGAWLSYGLGAETDSLPTFVVLPDARGIPTGGANNWTNGFLPARHQGTMLRTTGAAIEDLAPPQGVADETQLARLQLLREMNLEHLQARGDTDPLAARIRSYELAARMQSAVPEATDLDRETAETHALYGIDQGDSADFGRACLLARRLLERGVRFVQLWSGANFGGPTWDAHDDVPGNHGGEARRIDKPVAGLIADLRRLGMLDDTLVIFNTEFGRTPFAQSDAGQLGTGRDHNQTAFSAWLAGGGVKRGFSYGATDDFGYRAVENPVSVYDFHATILHLLGIDHTRLTYYHNGIERRLTNVHGHVIGELLA